MDKSALLKLLLLLVASKLIAAPAGALTGTWATNPVDGDWHVPSNWSSMAVPNGPADIATFGLSDITKVFLSANTEVDRIIFSRNASAYTITANPTHSLTVSGVGIVNDSGITQNLIAGVDSSGSYGLIRFTQNATAGSSISLTSSGAVVGNREGAVIEFRDRSTAGAGSLTASGGATSAGLGGNIIFFDSSSAARAALTVNGGAVGEGSPGRIEFLGSSTASQAVITANGGVFGNLNDAGGVVVFRNNADAAQATITIGAGNAKRSGPAALLFSDNATASTAMIINEGPAVERTLGGQTTFTGDASAANSVIVNNGGKHVLTFGGTTVFQNNATAGTATLIANGGAGASGTSGGEIAFYDNTTADMARIALFGTGRLTIRQHSAPGLTVGSLEGTGQVYLGGNNLSIGSNNSSTEFAGTMHDGDVFGADPTGGSVTKVGTGTLVLSGQHTYTGGTTVNAGKLIINGSVQTPVLVNGGTLGGTGTIGAVTVNSAATLAPGASSGILRVTGDLTLALGANYLVELNGTALGTQYDQTTVTGAVTLDRATLTLTLGFAPAPGTLFTLIENDGTDAVSGVFAGLEDGATFTADGQSFTISYTGGTGNDVVLMAVVPEPSTSLLLAAGLSLGVFLRRRLSSLRRGGVTQ